MRVSFVYPKDKQCGISVYGTRYLRALKQLPLEIDEIDTESFQNSVNECISMCSEADIVHIQYEPGFFSKMDLFSKLCRKIHKPVIVSLHEVYRRDPFSYPRENVRPPFLKLKRMIYDYRHPLQTMQRNHVNKRFFNAARILVHHQFQKEIVAQWGIEKRKITVIGHPVFTNAAFHKHSDDKLRLGCCGFLNPHYDFELLFKVLEGITTDWQFTWVGGFKKDQSALMSDLSVKITSMGWQDRFRITGWLGEPQFYDSLKDIDLALCLFSNRSSSGSIPEFIGAGIPVIATELPLTRELADHNGVLLCSNQPQPVLDYIHKYIEDEPFREIVKINTSRFAKENSYTQKALELYQVYNEVERE